MHKVSAISELHFASQEKHFEPKPSVAWWLTSQWLMDVGMGQIWDYPPGLHSHDVCACVRFNFMFFLKYALYVFRQISEKKQKWSAGQVCTVTQFSAEQSWNVPFRQPFGDVFLLSEFKGLISLTTSREERRGIYRERKNEGIGL